MIENVRVEGCASTLPSSEVTLEDVYREYYEELTEEFRSSTINRYKDEIPNIILPYFKGKKLSQCNLAFCKSVIKDIEKKGTRKSKGKTKFSNESVERFRFYIERLIKVAAKHGHCENFLCYTDFRIKRVRLVAKKKKNENKQLRRFLTIGEICKIVKIIFVDYKQTGQRMALLLMLICGLRNKEACGLLFGDIEEIVDHPGCYVLVIYKTTEGTGHNLKRGGKNRYVYRRIPIPKCLYDFLMLRKEYVAEMVNDVDVNTLPIACDGYNWRVHCASPQVTSAGRTVFSEIDFPEDLYWMAEELSGLDDSGYKEYKAPTAYIFRRNFASTLNWFGFSLEECQYLMGHAFLNKHANRDVYNNPDIQYKLYCVLSQRPFFPPFDSGCTRIEHKGNVMRIKGQTRATVAINQPGRYLIKVVGNHPDDPLSVSISANNEAGISGHYTISPSMASMPNEICLLQDYIDTYVKTWNSLYGDEKMETGY